MKIQKYMVGSALTLVLALAMSCEPDESLYPLPYDNRPTGSYLRAYRVVSNTWDLDDINDPLSLGSKSGFEAVYESVDKNFGADLDSIKIYATFRVGSTGRITKEVPVKRFHVSAFAPVPEPAYSDYLRSIPLRVTYQETLAALNTATADPDGTTCSGIFPDVCTMVGFPGTFLVGDRVIFRLEIKDNQGRKFTVANPQTTVTPAFGNQSSANITANLTGGLFYASPMLFTTLVQRTTTTGLPLPGSEPYTGTYLMTQRTRWQPDHSVQQHLSFPQSWIDQFAFGNPTAVGGTDSSQQVTLAIVPGGLATQRQFTCRYKGVDITMMINLEMATLPALTVSASALTTLNTVPPVGLGFPVGTAVANLGTVFVPLMNTGLDCTSAREFYMVTPLGGSYDVPTSPVNLTDALPWGLPRRSQPNRGVYRIDRTGLLPGDRFTIVVDDDADEYGRRNGYCNWYTRITLTMEKLP